VVVTCIRSLFETVHEKRVRELLQETGSPWREIIRRMVRRWRVQKTRSFLEVLQARKPRDDREEELETNVSYISFNKVTPVKTLMALRQRALQELSVSSCIVQSSPCPPALLLETRFPEIDPIPENTNQSKYISNDVPSSINNKVSSRLPSPRIIHRSIPHPLPKQET
jgi:hypothetical protein